MKRMRSLAAPIALGSVILLSIAACAGPAPSIDRVGVFVQDGPPGGSACPDIFIEGVLESSDRWLIGIAPVAGGTVRGVMWPPGYAAAHTTSGLVLLDEADAVVARVGDRVRSGGWDGADGVWLACRPEVLPSASPHLSPTPAGPPSIAGASSSPAAQDGPSSTLSPDATTALDLATHFETARAAGRWADAWTLLSAGSQATIGSLATFEANERAYNAAGGTVFAIQDPSRDPDLIANFLGADEARIASEADTERGWLVFIGHPDVQAASAGTTGLYMAPLASGEWRIWIVH